MMTSNHEKTTTEPAMRRFSSQKIAAYDSDGLWGAGDNEAQARAEAAGYLAEMFADPHDEAVTRTVAGLRFAPISRELLADLHDAGAGYEFFTIVDGILVPADEPFGSTAAAAALIEAVQ